MALGKRSKKHAASKKAPSGPPTRRCQRKQHPKFVALARRLTPPDVKVTFHNYGDFGHAYLEKRRIYVPRLTTVGRLQIYLHEVGHLLHPDRDDAEAEYLAESYSLKMLRRAGIHLPHEWRKGGIAYVGGWVINSVLKGRRVSEGALAFVGLKGMHRITIARAHAMAVARIGYTPERRWHGKTMAPAPPADTKYWDAVLAAVPAARRSTAAEIKRYEWEQQIDRERYERMIDSGDYYGD
jgi:hypothetical protein